MIVSHVRGWVGVAAFTLLNLQPLRGVMVGACTEGKKNGGKQDETVFGVIQIQWRKISALDNIEVLVRELVVVVI